MCLVIKSKKRPEPRIAKKAIKVWKRLDEFKDRYKSPYQGMIYERGNIYTSQIDTPEKHPWHHELWVINMGLHSYTLEARAIGAFMGIAKVEMYIPEGAVYYRGENHEIVSDTLIFI